MLLFFDIVVWSRVGILHGVEGTGGERRTEKEANKNQLKRRKRKEAEAADNGRRALLSPWSDAGRFSRDRPLTECGRVFAQFPHHRECSPLLGALVFFVSFFL